MRAPARRPRLLRQTSRALDVRAAGAAGGSVAEHGPRGFGGGLEGALELERGV